MGASAERMNGNRMRCGSVHHNLAGRPLKNTRQGKSKSTRLTNPRTRRRAREKGKTDKNQLKAKAKTGKIDFADEGQNAVEEDADVNQEYAEACEAVAEFFDNENIFGYVADWDASDVSDYKNCIRATVACDTASVPNKP